MTKKLFVIMLLVCSVFAANAQLNQVFMIGPMIHFNIGGPKFNVTYGIECSYWNYRHMPYSLDVGIDYGANKLRIYSEAQTGIGLIGVAFGPVFQYDAELNKANLGVQGSLWANYFAGVNLRFRHVGDNTVVAPGIYAKLPFGFGFYENMDDDDPDNDWDFDWD